MATNYSNFRKPTNSRIAQPPLLTKGPYELGLKRLVDVCFVLLALPLILPVIAVLAILVARDGGGAFYTQKRVGLNGKMYRIWKMRSMVHNADQLLGAHLAQNPDAAHEWERTQKLKSDPRITPLGHILRKCSLDELPQLWNVLIGDMSLVGPRPMLPEQRDMYPGLAYYTQRPGITGKWQVSKRNASSFADRARFDTDYISDISFINDMKLLWNTIGVVIKGTGY